MRFFLTYKPWDEELVRLPTSKFIDELSGTWQYVSAATLLRKVW
jgi:hypothetical protein